VKTSGATLKGRYTSYARFCIEMDIFGALSESISLDFTDEEWIQNIDYKHIPFRCRTCHENGHLIRECPLNKKKETTNPKTQQDEEGFITLNPRDRENKKKNKTSAGNNQNNQNKMEGREQTNKGTTDENDLEKVQEVRDQEAKEPTHWPNNTIA